MPKQTTKKRIAFRLHAPEASEVFLVGSFNDWDITGRPMKQDEKGTWKTTVSLEPGVHEYRFIVDGEWQDDPGCEERSANAFGAHNCMIRI